MVIFMPCAERTDLETRKKRVLANIDCCYYALAAAADREKPFQIDNFHVLLCSINPPVWRRLLMRNDSNIVDLHYTLQIAFHWSDFHLHRLLNSGKQVPRFVKAQNEYYRYN
ncbi:MAG: hypothetical protein QOH96_2309 [Blastocatellia bacterium]|nr:hypothetical protein [Blastocatellia bacterium]